MKKIIFTLAAILTMAFSSLAVNYTHSLIINKHDGTDVEYKFTDQPVASFDGNNLKITLNSTGQTLFHPISDVANMKFTKYEDTGVESIQPSANPSFGLTKDTLEASGIEAGTQVNVFDLNGAVVAKGIADASGIATLDISALPAGVYAVAAGKHAFKFVK